MENFKDRSSILYIPGWLDTGKVYGYRNYLDFWYKKTDISVDFKADVVIAHSVGALIALNNWSKHRNFKLILINPVFTNKKIFRRWCKFIIHEGLSDSLKKSIKPFYLFSSHIKLRRLFKTTSLDLLNRIPVKDILIVYGTNDIYLGDRKLINELTRRGVKTIEVDGAAHNYDNDLELSIQNAFNLFV